MGQHRRRGGGFISTFKAGVALQRCTGLFLFLGGRVAFITEASMGGSLFGKFNLVDLWNTIWPTVVSLLTVMLLAAQGAAQDVADDPDTGVVKRVIAVGAVALVAAFINWLRDTTKPSKLRTLVTKERR